jgi:small subunit ribosomal protein S15
MGATMYDLKSKAEIIKKFRTNEKDTASPQVQIALLSARLDYLKGHFAANPKDHHSRTGLLKIVGRRRRFLDYLKRNDEPAYKSIIESLGIRK